MPYVMRGPDGHIEAVRPMVDDIEAAKLEGWLPVEDKNPEYIAFLEKELLLQDPFRESDIHLARVLEDLISLLTDKQIIRFTDFPAAAQKRLLERQQMRKKSNILDIIDSGDDSPI
jgi:hypothetical protein